MFESLREGFPSRWESVRFCPIDASIRGWQGLPFGYVLWNRITNYYSRLARTTFLWPPRVTLGRLLPHAKGLGFKPRRGGFPSGAKKEWGLFPKAKVQVLHTAQLDVTVSSNH
nr:hypothetical protein [Tanacetum cinerariifolium]